MILNRLKAETQLYHQRLEERLDLLTRMHSLAAYRGILQQFFGFYVPLEPLVWDHPEWLVSGFDIEARRKTPLLRQDLLRLGLTGQAISALPICGDVPQVPSFAHALGCLYVLEGATLGGQIIARHLKRTLNLEAAQGGAFFSSYGEQVGPMWRAFGSFLTAHAQTPQDETAMLEAACATFVKFDAWLACAGYGAAANAL